MNSRTTHASLNQVQREHADLVVSPAVAGGARQAPKAIGGHRDERACPGGAGRDCRDTAGRGQRQADAAGMRPVRLTRTARRASAH